MNLREKSIFWWCRLNYLKFIIPAFGFLTLINSSNSSFIKQLCFGNSWSSDPTRDVSSLVFNHVDKTNSANFSRYYPVPKKWLSDAQLIIAFRFHSNNNRHNKIINKQLQYIYYLCTRYADCRYLNINKHKTCLLWKKETHTITKFCSIWMIFFFNIYI